MPAAALARPTMGKDGTRYCRSKAPTPLVRVLASGADAASCAAVFRVLHEEAGVQVAPDRCDVLGSNIVLRLGGVEESKRAIEVLDGRCWGTRRLTAFHVRLRNDSSPLPENVRDPPAWTPPGLTMVRDFLGAAEQEELTALAAGGPWERTPGGKRRIKHYGWHVNYATTSVAHLPSQPLPACLERLADRALAHCPAAARLDQVTINEYEPGQGIGEHVDAHEAFEDTIAIVSLGSPAVLVLRERSDAGRLVARVDIPVPPGSLVLLADAARYLYTHEVPQRASDVVNGSCVPRSLRYSVTLRRVRRRPCSCPFPSQCDTQNRSARTRQKEKAWATAALPGASAEGREPSPVPPSHAAGGAAVAQIEDE